MILIAKIDISGLPLTLNQIRSKHWRRVYEENKKWKALVYHACHNLNVVGLKLASCVLKCTRISTYQPDYDNLVGSFKPVIDGLVMAQVIKNDDPKVIGSPEYGWSKGKRIDQGIRIEIFKEASPDKASQP